MSVLTLASPAKINLFLHILNRRADGYHNLLMAMEKLSLCDTLTLELADDIVLEGSPPDVPIEKNLVYRAAKLLQATAGIKKGAKIGLKKIIPMGGGLGGGSSNAATALKGLSQLWDLNLSTEKLAKLGVQLGADVPFFIYEGPALVGGIGDLIKPLNKLPKLWIILINPGVHVATPWAYKAWDLKAQPKQLTQENQNVRSFPSFATLIQVLHNDFEEVVIPEFSEIGEAKKTLEEVGAKALMSGSGSTVFGLFETKEARDRAVDRIKIKEAWQMFVVEN